MVICIQYMKIWTLCTREGGLGFKKNILTVVKKIVGVTMTVSQ
jgi:hypothetical protein